ITAPDETAAARSRGKPLGQRMFGVTDARMDNAVVQYIEAARGAGTAAERKAGKIIRTKGGALTGGVAGTTSWGDVKSLKGGKAHVTGLERAVARQIGERMQNLPGKQGQDWKAGQQWQQTDVTSLIKDILVEQMDAVDPDTGKSISKAEKIQRAETMMEDKRFKGIFDKLARDIGQEYEAGAMRGASSLQESGYLMTDIMSGFHKLEKIRRKAEVENSKSMDEMVGDMPGGSADRSNRDLLVKVIADKDLQQKVVDLGQTVKEGKVGEAAVERKEALADAKKASGDAAKAKADADVMIQQGRAGAAPFEESDVGKAIREKDRAQKALTQAEESGTATDAEL
ncbi:uncharacterized protein METZ01_LOCUS328458, partial [marine metagenome]